MKIENKIIGIDVDETLCKEICWTPEQCVNATPIKETIEKVNNLYKKNIIIIYTARRDCLMEATLTFLRKNGVMFHAISNIKIPLDITLDVNNLRPEEI